MMRELLRRVEMKVISENHLDAVVRLHYSLPPGKIGLAPQPEPPGTSAIPSPPCPYAYYLFRYQYFRSLAPCFSPAS